MAKATDDYFDKKRPWSKVKDELLRCYLGVYMQKIIQTMRPVVYIDCFAGKGFFGYGAIPDFKIDSEEIPDCLGSPFIALKELTKACNGASGKLSKDQYRVCFIEKKYHDDLRMALESSMFNDSDVLEYQVIGSDSFDEMPKIANWIFRKTGRDKPNLFCYIDPFGPLVLDLEKLECLCRSKPNSIELLINFSSFGLFRAACASMSVSLDAKIKEQLNGLEGDGLVFDEDSKSSSGITNVMGTEDWKDIINEYKNNLIDGYEAEERLAKLYQKQLKAILGFGYVLSMPISWGNNRNHPKYRMIHATNHEDGAVLMGRNMLKRTDYLFEKKRSANGELELFDQEDYYQPSPVDQNILEILDDIEEIGVKKLTAKYFEMYGLESEINPTLKKLEKEGRVIVRRDPATTENGKQRDGFSENAKQKVYIRKP
jgi:three-Cys-motif partner protein